MRSDEQRVIDEIRAMRVDAIRMEIMRRCPACATNIRQGWQCGVASCNAKPIQDMLDSLMGQWADEVTMKNSTPPPY